MIQVLPPVAEPVPADRQSAIEDPLDDACVDSFDDVLENSSDDSFDDSEWLDAQFAAIMKANGFVDQTTVAALWGPYDGRRRRPSELAPRRWKQPAVRSSDRSRVRSPPDIG